MAWPRVQDRRILATLLTALVALAWWALWLGEQSPWGHHLLHGAAANQPASPLTFAVVFVCGWLLMTVAMMLPASSPLILLFHRMLHGRGDASALIALLIGGYLAVWLFFGVLIFALTRAAQAAAASVPWLIQNRWTPAAILLTAGVYQFTPLKYACLDKCRSPMTFLVQRWRAKRPTREAFRLGVDHGLYCVGCCWSLMLVMFAMSAGSLVSMLALGVAMAAEKNLPWGRRLSAPVGVLLIAAAAAFLIT